MSGIPITIPGPTSTAGLQMGFYFKMGYTSTILTPICLVQLVLPASGFITVYLNTNATVTGQTTTAAGGGNWNASVTSSSGITVGTWYYVTYCLGYSSPNLVQRLYIYQGNVGWYDSGQSSLGQAPTQDVRLTAVLGLGVDIINCGTAFVNFQHFPLDGSCVMNRFWLRNANVGPAWGGPTGGGALVAPHPDSDIMNLNPLVYYLAHQPTGAAASLLDTSPNGYNALAGPLGLQILADSPWQSQGIQGGGHS